jgi:3-phenylpropionate/trans-cinnamate dioxygenase ferredoxin reductase component
VTTRHDDAIAVVGAGLGGIRTIEALRRNGYTGPITLIGDEVHPPYDRPPLSKGVLAGTADPASVRLTDPSLLGELGVRWYAGATAIGLDADERRIHLDDGTTVGFTKLAIATGASPKVLPGSQALCGVHVLRSLDDALKLRAAAMVARNICVLGAGVLGLEIAATLSTSAPVIVVEAADRMLVRAFPRGGATAEVLAGIHRDAGVTLKVATKVVRLLGQDRVTGVELATGERLDADLVVVAIGAVPAAEWLAGSGIETQDGVLCDEHNKTNINGIFAIGDAARQVNSRTGRNERFEHWTSAVEQSQVVAHNLLADAGPEFVRYEGVPYVWSDQFDRKLQIVGRPAEADDETVVVHDGAQRRAASLYSKNGTVVGLAALGIPKALPIGRRLIASALSLSEAVEALRSKVS